MISFALKSLCKKISMKKILLIIVIVTNNYDFTFSQTTIIDFEIENSGYTASSTEGSNITDVFNRINSNIGGNSSFIWAVEDLNLVDPSIILDHIDVSGSSSFSFAIDMIAHHYNDWDSKDELKITYSLDGGTDQNLMWVQNAGGTYNETAALDTDFDGDGECENVLPSLILGTSGCTASENNFRTFTTQQIPLNGNSTLQIKLQFKELNASDEGIYLDNIVITEYSTFDVSLTGNAGYRLLSTPVTTSYSDILDEIWTQGATSADATNGAPNVFTWSKTSTNGDNTNWSGVTNLDDSPTAGEGFLVYVYADDDFDGSDDAFPKTLSVSGTEHADAYPTINSNGDGWTLLGNPFTSTIDFDLLTTSEITGIAYVWDPNAGGSGEWKTWNGTTGDITDGLITPYQGFFVQTQSSPTSPSVAFPSNAKSTGGTFYGKTVKNIQRLRLNVKGDLFSNSAWIQLSEKGSINDKVFGDALELQPLATSYAQLGFIKSGEVMNIAHLNTEEEVVVPIEFNTTEGGLYTISATDFEISGDTEVTFHDYQEAVSMVVDGSFSYTFEAVKLKKQDIPPLSMLSVNAMQFKSTEANRFGITIRPTSVNNEVIEKPKVFALEQNYPNPFNPSTTISYTLSESGAVNIGVYNLMGQRIATLVDEYKTAGTHNISWNAQGASSGMYYYRLESNGNAITRKMTLIK